MSVKWERLTSWFPETGILAVAFSGGVDSTLVLKAALDSAGAARVMAITADSASLARSELQAACDLAKALGVPHTLLSTGELDDPAYIKNDGARCFHCKRSLYEALGKWLDSPAVRAQLAGARASGLPVTIVDGLNADDLREARPGRQASDQAGVKHPLVEVGFGKKEVRALAREAGLPNWDKPAMACLASRIATGTAVTAERLSLVEQAEGSLTLAGFAGTRVRMHILPGEPERKLARIELQVADFQRFFSEGVREAISHALRTAGFDYITVDAEGYKLGGVASTR